MTLQHDTMQIQMEGKKYMEKVERVLTLFWQLYKGTRINKASFCFEMNVAPRTFDRDIEDIRIFLSENYSGQDIIFDRISNTYYMTGVTNKVLTEVEYTAIIAILLGSRALRRDEMEGFIRTLGKMTERLGSGTENEIKQMCRQYNGDIHKNAILKMQWDLFQCIKRRLVIRIQYLDESYREGEKAEVVPYRIFFVGNSFKLEAIDLEGGTNEYCVERIESFEIIRSLNSQEQEIYFKEKTQEEK